MKRRGFLGWVLGTGAAPAAAAIAASLPKEVIEPDPSFEPLPREISGGYGVGQFYTAMAPVSTQRFMPSAEYDQRHGIKKCSYCGGRGFADYVKCRNCGAEDWES